MKLNKIYLFFALLITLNIINYAQEESDTIEYNFGFLFNDGIYLDFNNFRNNKPLDFFRFIYPSFIDDNFFQKLDSVPEIIFTDDLGISIKKSKFQIWGYCKNGKPYVFYNGKANLIPFVGSISHFVSSVKVMYNNFYDPFYDPFYYPYYSPTSMNRSYQSEELRHYIIDMETGKILEYNLSNIEEIFKREPKIYNEFSKLSKRKKNKQMFYYIRLYNELRPLRIPKNQ